MREASACNEGGTLHAMSHLERSEHLLVHLLVELPQRVHHR